MPLSQKSLNLVLRQQKVPNDIRSVLYHIARAVKYINFSLRAGHTGQIGTTNIQGEAQLELDVIADKIIMKELEQSGLVSCAISEEQDEANLFEAERGKYTVAYDPLDGSSLVDSNLAIGSIFGIWKGSDLNKKTGNDLSASCYAVYGPRVTFTIAVKGKGVHTFEMNDVGEFMLIEQLVTLEKTSKYFAPGNLKAMNTVPAYQNLVNAWITENRTLRYSGGMVPDLHHILCKKSGIFAYPADTKYPNGKLRLAFECAPMAFIFRECGGTAKDQNGTDILDLEITDIHGRTSIFIGSSDEVEKALEFFG
jgi:fructose-1,6-bisphosphatase I